jgi:SAM-dependent methyltransferase
MKTELLSILCCPACRGHLELSNAHGQNDEIEEGLLRCNACGESYPIIRWIPRFVPMENYAANFGLQWNRFRKTQLDSYSGHPISRDRFVNETGLTPAGSLKNKVVLDAGCGAGRFAEIALSLGAQVVAIDYSNAVEACRQNLCAYKNLNIVQADIYHLPFVPKRFDTVYSLGVLQHTPDVRKAFVSLVDQLKPGGHITVDLYLKQWINVLLPKYWLRPLTKHISNELLFRLVELMVPFFLPISICLGRVPFLGRKLRHIIPVANYDGIFPLSPTQIREWAILDTYDMLAPKYDQPQTAESLKEWFQAMGLQGFDIFRHGVLVGRGCLPG